MNLISLINISHLTFGYDNGFGNVFEDVSFQIDTDWKLGFIGRNGRGKTTFLNLLMGKYEYRGIISASVCFDYFPYSIKDESRDTLAVIERIVPDYELWLLQKELSLLNVEEEILYRPFATLSNGERTKVLLASLFLRQNYFLLIDEPTNHLDAEGRRLVADYLNGKKGFILVSHDRNFLDRCVDHTLSINRRNIEVQRGNFSSWQKNKQMQDEYELAENERLKKDVKKLSAAAKRTADWSEKTEKSKVGQKKTERKCAVHDRGFIGHKAAKIMKRSKTLEARQQSAIEEKSTLLKNIDSADSLALRSLIYPQETLIEASDLSLFYGDKSVCTSVRFTVNRGDRVALAGKNGSGKSSLLKLITGESIRYTGNLRLGSGLKISYIPQDTSHLSGNLREFALKTQIDESLFKTILRKLDFSREQLERDIRDFSGGQKKKVLLAKSLCEEAHLYLWDEPLNFVDVLSRLQVEELIRKFNPTMIFVEHDAAFCDSIATKRVLLVR